MTEGAFFSRLLHSDYSGKPLLKSTPIFMDPGTWLPANWLLCQPTRSQAENTCQSTGTPCQQQHSQISAQTWPRSHCQTWNEIDNWHSKNCTLYRTCFMRWREQPADTWRKNNAITTPKRRRDVTPTQQRRHHHVMCPPSKSVIYVNTLHMWPITVDVFLKKPWLLAFNLSEGNKINSYIIPSKDTQISFPGKICGISPGPPG